ncbi:MAG: peptidylprolyl isomerase [Ignavibacteriales bacterium]|nr:peptidylprolyl isomerase [Ignavibacteriaceae bacterium]QOJ28675.1 MAG: peptidylprolyl isomerase [Ignavibacteriales bacterium]
MKKLLILLFLSLAASLPAQDVIDKIVAIVDNEVILKSELDFQVNMVANQRKLDPSNPNLRTQVLNAMIEEKLLYAQALLDSIVVSEEEVRRQIDYQIETIISQVGSKEKVEQMYGMTMEKIRREIRDNVRKEILVNRMQEKKFGMIESSRREVEEFFTKFKDSLGVIPEKVKLSHIFRNPQTSATLKQKYFDLAKAILDSIKAGADFSEMAKKYSEDPGSAAAGGDLGYVKRGVFYPEFESAAFALEVNELSDIVESPVGYHIIQLMDRRGESISTRHILIKIKADSEADLDAIDFLTSVRDSVLKGHGKFSDFARKYSDDPETKDFGGALGTFYMEQLDKNLLDIVTKTKEGDISYPKRINVSQINYGYHIVWIEQRIPQHKPDLDIDFTDLKKLSDEYKKQRLYAEFVSELKSKIFWEIKI